MKKLISYFRLVFGYLTGHKRQIIAGIICGRDGRILIARRKISDRMGGKWEFPGGKLEAGESHESCLKRELKEELNIDVKVNGLFSRSVFRYMCVPIELICYKTDLIGGDIKLNDHEEYAWVKPEELSGFDFTEADKAAVKKLEDVL